MTKSVLREWVVDGNSYMEPEDYDFLPDSDDFFSESSDGNKSDEPVPLYVGNSEKCFFTT